MAQTTERELDRAIEDLGKLIRGRHGLTRHVARALLVPLGKLLNEAPESAQERLGRLSELVAQARPDWEKVVKEELALACSEYVQSVDPRFLDHARYDFAYTIAARERLEARINAASAFDLGPEEGHLQAVVRADTILEPFLRAQDGDLGAN